jgi:hypothetical protein
MRAVAPAFFHRGLSFQSLSEECWAFQLPGQLAARCSTIAIAGQLDAQAQFSCQLNEDGGESVELTWHVTAVDGEVQNDMINSLVRTKPHNFCAMFLEEMHGVLDQSIQIIFRGIADEDRKSGSVERGARILLDKCSSGRSSPYRQRSQFAPQEETVDQKPRSV